MIVAMSATPAPTRPAAPRRPDRVRSLKAKKPPLV
jgi:hypothetical protein